MVRLLIKRHGDLTQRSVQRERICKTSQIFALVIDNTFTCTNLCMCKIECLTISPDILCKLLKVLADREMKF